jgi:hypothetical protein
MMQLSLWDDAPTQEIPETLYLEHHWADGDEDPDQLERLSHVILGNISMFDRSDGKPKEVYRIVTTGIVDNKVIAAYEYLCNVKEFYGGSSSSTSPETYYEDDDLDDL